MKNLTTLKADPNPPVRKSVAYQGYALGELKDDLEGPVRSAVARQGYALDELKNDPYGIVREAAIELKQRLGRGRSS